MIQNLPDWHLDAACRGMDSNLFFPSPTDDTTVAKAICASCPVQVDCREWAIETVEPAGIWGGLTNRHRTVIRKQRKLELPDDAKRCAQCGAWKPHAAFPRSPSNRDGLHSYCRSCRQRNALVSRNQVGWRGPSANLQEVLK